MAKKIDIKSVTKDFQEAQDLNFTKYQILESKHNSTSTFENTTSTILNIILVYQIIVVTSFYELENLNACILPETKVKLKEYKSFLIRRVSQEQLKSNESRYFIFLLNKYSDFELTKEEFMQQKHIQFDSASNEHDACFGNLPPSQRGQNIVLKIRSSGNEREHIRCGIMIDLKNQIIMIKDVVKKSKKKKVKKTNFLKGL